MLSRIESFLSFLFLSVTSGFCLYNFYTTYGLYGERGLLLQFPYAIYLFTTAHGVIGDIIYLQDSPDYTLWRWLYNTEIFIEAISFPSFVTEIWLEFGIIDSGSALVHAIIGAIPASLFILDNRLRKSWIDVIVYVSTIAIAWVCLQFPNAWCLAAAITFSLGYCILRQRLHLLKLDPDVWFNIFTGLFCMCSYFAIDLKRTVKK